MEVRMAEKFLHGYVLHPFPPTALSVSYPWEGDFYFFFRTQKKIVSLEHKW